MVIAVGYRVNSFQTTQFRIWATKTLREFLVKGFVLDEARLQQGKQFGTDYFEELLDRTSNAAPTRKRTQKSRRRFSKPFRRNCVGPSLEKPLRRVLPNAPIRQRLTRAKTIWKRRNFKI